MNFKSVRLDEIKSKIENVRKRICYYDTLKGQRYKMLAILDENQVSVESAGASNEDIQRMYELYIIDNCKSVLAECLQTLKQVSSEYDPRITKTKMLELHGGLTVLQEPTDVPPYSSLSKTAQEALIKYIVDNLPHVVVNTMFLEKLLDEVARGASIIKLADLVKFKTIQFKDTIATLTSVEKQKLLSEMNDTASFNCITFLTDLVSVFNNTELSAQELFLEASKVVNKFKFVLLENHSLRITRVDHIVDSQTFDYVDVDVMDVYNALNVTIDLVVPSATTSTNIGKLVVLLEMFEESNLDKINSLNYKNDKNVEETLFKFYDETLDAVDKCLSLLKIYVDIIKQRQMLLQDITESVTLITAHHQQLVDKVVQIVQLQDDNSQTITIESMSDEVVIVKVKFADRFNAFVSATTTLGSKLIKLDKVKNFEQVKNLLQAAVLTNYGVDLHLITQDYQVLEFFRNQLLDTVTLSDPKGLNNKFLTTAQNHHVYQVLKFLPTLRTYTEQISNGTYQLRDPDIHDKLILLQELVDTFIAQTGIMPNVLEDTAVVSVEMVKSLQELFEESDIKVKYPELQRFAYNVSDYHDILDNPNYTVEAFKEFQNELIERVQNYPENQILCNSVINIITMCVTTLRTTRKMLNVAHDSLVNYLTIFNTFYKESK